MKKVLLIFGIALVAGVGAIVAVFVASRSGSSARPPVSEPGGTTAPGASSTSTTAQVVPSPTTAPPVPTTTAALPPPPGPHSERRRLFMVGTVDDSLAQRNLSAARTRVELSRRAGFDAVILSVPWQRGQTRPSAGVLRGMQNVGRAVRDEHMRLFLVAWHGFARNTPRSPGERAQFASFAAELVKEAPVTTGVIVGNEPNLNTFWMPQFGTGGRDLAAPAYEDLLARTYDALKGVDPRVRVIGGALSPRGADRAGGVRPTHSPTTFIRDLGAAYRASGRTRPLMDAFAIHPYMLSSAVAPGVEHTKTTQITIADYPKLVTLLDEAFRGTAQRGRTLPILYAEFGVQTTVPERKLRLYTTATAPKAATVTPVTQAAYYRQALALSYCQPTVTGLFFFHTYDEQSLDGWQSGLYYVDGTAKPSLPDFRHMVTELRDGRLTACSR